VKVANRHASEKVPRKCLSRGSAGSLPSLSSAAFIIIIVGYSLRQARGGKKLSWTFVLNDMRSTPTHIVEIRLSLLKWRAGGATEDKSAVTKLRRGLDNVWVYHCAAASALMDMWVENHGPA
jgi:hypothetical protein